MTDATAQEITITRVFDAPRELVWKSWTEPEQLAQWWGPAGWSTPVSAVTMDVRPGGEFSLTSTNEDGAEMPVRGDLHGGRAARAARARGGRRRTRGTRARCRSCC